VYAPIFAAISGEYLTLMPVNEGRPPLELRIENLLTGRLEANDLGSSNNFTTWLPVLVMVATTFNLSTPSTSVGPRCVKYQAGLWL